MYQQSVYMSRIDLSGILSCFNGIPWLRSITARASVPKETRLTTAVEMLESQAARLTAAITEREGEARALVRAGRKAEAKQKLRDCQITRKRLGTTQGVLMNLHHMMCEIEDNKMYAYSIDAMSSVAKEYNYSSANLDGLYKRLTSAQDRLSEFHDQSNEINAVLSENIDPGLAIDDDDLEAELEGMLSEEAPGSSPAEVSVPVDAALPSVPASAPHPRQVPAAPVAPAAETMPAAQPMQARDLRSRFNLEAV